MPGTNNHHGHGAGTTKQFLGIFSELTARYLAKKGLNAAAVLRKYTAWGLLLELEFPPEVVGEIVEIMEQMGTPLTATSFAAWCAQMLSTSSSMSPGARATLNLFPPDGDWGCICDLTLQQLAKMVPVQCNPYPYDRRAATTIGIAIAYEIDERLIAAGHCLRVEPGDEEALPVAVLEATE